ncbi:MAG: hypothetical protein J6Y97_01220 [Prevotella sp.]|nr:hypothetical protein [Prevotella sp.]
MNKKSIITFVLCLMSLATYATGQDGDVIYIDGTQWSLLGQPISRDSVLQRQVRAAIPQQHVIISSNWSGYTAFWSIKQDVLYLDSIQYLLSASGKKTLSECIPAETLQRVFKNYFDGKHIVAKWLKGDIRVARGKMLYYEHMGYERNYEEEQIISFDHGKVTGVKVVHNYVKEGFSFDQVGKTQMGSMDITPAQLREMFPLHLERYPELANEKRIMFSIRRAKIDETGHLVDCEVRVMKPSDNKQLADEMAELMKAYYPWRVAFINGEYRANGIERYTFSYPLK